MTLGPFTQLGITRNSSIEDIKAAYKMLVKKHHPDRGGTKEGFIELKETYDKLIAHKEGKLPIDEHIYARPQSKITVNGWWLDKKGNGIIDADFQLMMYAETLGKLYGRYDWTLLGQRGGYFEVSRKDLVRCNYKVEIRWVGFGFREITKTYEFQDNRGWLRKIMDWLFYSVY